MDKLVLFLQTADDILIEDIDILFWPEADAMATAQSRTAGVTQAIAELVYQDGGIVSRVLLKKPSGNVTLFAFDAGEELSEHTCPYDALVHVVAGTGEVTVGGERHSLSAGEMVLLPSDVPHAVRAPSRFKMLLTILRG